MANWPVDPTWIDPVNINKGKEYSSADGVAYTDFNNVIKNLLYLQKYGSEKLVRFDVPCDNKSCELTIMPGVIYNITDCGNLKINIPEALTDYLTHVFVSFSTEVTNINIVLPEDAYVFGSSPDRVSPGDKWEFSIDSTGGILCVRKI